MISFWRSYRRQIISFLAPIILACVMVWVGFRVGDAMYAMAQAMCEAERRKQESALALKQDEVDHQKLLIDSQNGLIGTLKGALQSSERLNAELAARLKQVEGRRKGGIGR